MTTIETNNNLDNSSNLLAKTSQENGKPLRQCVHNALTNYFNKLEGYDPLNLYSMVLEEIEIPLFEAVMGHVRGNQSRAAVLLGLSRSTSRKKLQQYGLL